MTDPREPLWSCPKCDEKRYSVIGCWGIKQHMWEKHGIPSDITFNGRTRRLGPKNPVLFHLLKWWRSR